MIQQLHISYEQKLLTSTDSIDPFLLENIIKKEIQNTQHATGKSLSFSSSCLSFVSIFVCVCSFLVILLWKRKKKIFLSFFLFFYVFSFLWPILSISGHSGGGFKEDCCGGMGVYNVVDNKEKTAHLGFAVAKRVFLQVPRDGNVGQDM